MPGHDRGKRPSCAIHQAPDHVRQQHAKGSKWIAVKGDLHRQGIMQNMRSTAPRSERVAIVGCGVHTRDCRCWANQLRDWFFLTKYVLASPSVDIQLARFQP